MEQREARAISGSELLMLSHGLSDLTRAIR